MLLLRHHLEDLFDKHFELVEREFTIFIGVKFFQDFLDFGRGGLLDSDVGGNALHDGLELVLLQEAAFVQIYGLEGGLGQLVELGIVINNGLEIFVHCK